MIRSCTCNAACCAWLHSTPRHRRRPAERDAYRRGPHLLHTAALSGPGRVACQRRGCCAGGTIKLWVRDPARATGPWVACTSGTCCTTRCEVPRAVARVRAAAPPGPDRRRVPSRYGPDSGGVPGPARFGHRVSGSAEIGTPVQNTATPARHDRHTPATVVLPRRRRPPQGAGLRFQPPSQSTDLSTYPQARTPPAPAPPPPFTATCFEWIFG